MVRFGCGLRTTRLSREKAIAPQSIRRLMNRMIPLCWVNLGRLVDCVLVDCVLVDWVYKVNFKMFQGHIDDDNCHLIKTLKSDGSVCLRYFQKDLSRKPPMLDNFTEWAKQKGLLVYFANLPHDTESSNRFPRLADGELGVESICCGGKIKSSLFDQYLEDFDYAPINCEFFSFSLSQESIFVNENYHVRMLEQEDQKVLPRKRQRIEKSDQATPANDDLDWIFDLTETVPR